MEEINLTELLSYYLKKLPIIILVTVLMVLVGYFYSEEIQVPMYHGTTTIILVQKSDDNQSANMTQSEVNLNEKLVSTYSQIIKSRRVLEQVIDTVGLDTTTDKLANHIDVTSVSETSIIKVTVSDEDKELAVAIANELATVFKKEISKIYNLENISVIDSAIVEEKPYNVHLLKQLVLFGGAGFVLCCAVLFVIFYFDNTIKNKKEVESKLGLAVIGEIPVATKLEILEKKRKKITEQEMIDFNHVDDTLKKSTKRKVSTKQNSTAKKVKGGK